MADKGKRVEPLVDEVPCLEEDWDYLDNSILLKP